MSDESTPDVDGWLKVDGDKLKVAARLQGMTLTTLAEAMGMHYNGILRIAQTGTTNLRTVEELCNVLKCSPLDLLIFEGYPPPKLAALVSLFSQWGVKPHAIELLGLKAA